MDEFDFEEEASLAAIEEALDALMAKGLVELAGVNEDGEITYQLTPKGVEFGKFLIEGDLDA